MSEAFPRGRFAWHELMTTDTAAAVSFYSQVVGWGTMAWDQDPSYILWTMRGEPEGGLMILPEEAKQQGAPPNWLPYVAVPDAAATVRQATGLGATALADVNEVPTVGRFAVLQDPQQAVFAVLQPAGDVPGHDGEPKRGEFSWHELATTDWKAAFAFYNALFGWEKTDSMDMGPMGVYQMFGRRGRTLGGMYNKPPDMPAPPHWLCYAVVPSADAAAAKAKSLGGQVLNGPMDVPGGSGDRVAQCMDPQGAAFAVHSAAVVAVPEPVAAPAARRPEARVAKPAATAPAKQPATKATKRPAKRAKAKKVVKRATKARRKAKKTARKKRR